MQDEYSINSHKLMYHPERIALWKGAKKWEGVKKIYPIYAEISLSSVCNHRCQFCALDYLGYKDGFADFGNLKKVVKDMAQGGVKSIMFSGEGEPLLYPKLKEIVKYVKSLDIDISITTNGTFFTEELAKEILPFVTWIKVSIDAGTAKTHANIHQTDTKDFRIIMRNLQKVVAVKREIKSVCTLGGQMILLPENVDEAVLLAKKLRRIGVDYFVIKRYSHNDLSITQKYKTLSCEKYLGLKNDLESLNSQSFKIIFRDHIMDKDKCIKNYSVCHAVPFLWVHIMTNGDVYGCGNYLKDTRFKMGNYNEKSFKEIWEGEGRKRLWQFIKKDLDVSKCRENCRMDGVNEYLEKLNNPPDHVNFI